VFTAGARDDEAGNFVALFDDFHAGSGSGRDHSAQRSPWVKPRVHGRAERGGFVVTFTLEKRFHKNKILADAVNRLTAH
jgi:hypothetical protein